jgi:hypothetical protein
MPPTCHVGVERIIDDPGSRVRSQSLLCQFGVALRNLEGAAERGKICAAEPRRGGRSLFPRVRRCLWRCGIL